MKSDETPAGRYFDSVARALDGLDAFLGDDESPLYKHDVIGQVVEEYLGRLRCSLETWRNRIAFTQKFRISQAESGFPAFRHVLELKNDFDQAQARLAGFPDEIQLREAMVDHILTRKSFPHEAQKQLAERRYLEAVLEGRHFMPFNLPRTVRVSVNPKTRRPYYIVHWGYYDGTANLPMVYMLSLEDSSRNMLDSLVGKDGKLKSGVEIPLPVEGLLNPDLAHQFDNFCEANSAYSYTLTTIATNLDKDFEYLHPKQLRRFVLGPFYHADITVHGAKVDQILAKVRKRQNQWLMTWSLEELYSMHEKPAKWGLWGGEPARDEFFINTEDLECVRMGVSAYERHALVPHDAYQAIYAAGEADEIFDGFETHIITGNRVLRRI